MPKPLQYDYLQVQAQTAGPGQRVVMMYGGIIKSLHQALAAFEADSDSPESLETINNRLTFAQQLVLELQLALDMADGAEVAAHLDPLYDFWRRHLSQANAEKSPAKVKEVLEMVADLKSAWEEAAREAIKLGAMSN